MYPRRFLFGEEEAGETPADLMDTYDAMGAVGLAMLAAGLYLVYAPLALIVPGAVLVIGALAGAARRGKD